MDMFDFLIYILLLMAEGLAFYGGAKLLGLVFPGVSLNYTQALVLALLYSFHVHVIAAYTTRAFKK
jgi:hypothetical protein